MAWLCVLKMLGAEKKKILHNLLDWRFLSLGHTGLQLQLMYGHRHDCPQELIKTRKLMLQVG